jgi:hypothetical protein
LLRTDRLLGLPAADRQGFGCSPAIEGISIQYPPKYARFFDERQAPIIRSAAEGGDFEAGRRAEKRKAGADDTSG